jgi:hypothetical protein
MLREAIRSAAIGELETIGLYLINQRGPSERAIWKFLYDNQIIDNSAMERALEKAVFAQAKRDYAHVLKKQSTPDYTSLDHLIVPEYFAYAITHGVFSEKELSKIRFEPQETPNDFARLNGRNNLLSHLREALLNPPAPWPKSSMSSVDLDLEHPVCDCGN